MGAAERAKSLEQQVRDILSAARIEGAQAFTAGDLLEAANLLGEQTRQAEQTARDKVLEEAAQVADASAPLISGSPGPLFEAGWNTACGGIAGAIRALKDKP